MIQLKINDSIKSLANSKAEAMGVLNKSILQGKGNLAGIVGEILVKEYLKAEQEESYDYDLSRDGITYDVKTKQVSTTPLEHYECSIAEYQKKQDCDRYVFVRVNLTENKAWILGWIDKDDFFEEAKLVKEGEGGTSNGWTPKINCYNLQINRLKDITIL
jgi:hypothetical protein